MTFITYFTWLTGNPTTTETTLNVKGVRQQIPRRNWLQTNTTTYV